MPMLSDLEDGHLGYCNRQVVVLSGVLEIIALMLEDSIWDSSHIGLILIVKNTVNKPTTLFDALKQ